MVKRTVCLIACLMLLIAVAVLLALLALRDKGLLGSGVYFIRSLTGCSR